MALRQDTGKETETGLSFKKKPKISGAKMSQKAF